MLLIKKINIVNYRNMSHNSVIKKHNVLNLCILWVRWADVCKPRKEGGLGVKDLGGFNLALLAKWAWKFLTEPNSLWVEVIKARGQNLVYDREAFQQPFLRSCSRWWLDVVKVCDSQHSNWFLNNATVSVGNGRTIRFWEDAWLSNKPLCDTFPRLYQAAVNKFCPLEGVVNDADGT